MGENNDENIQYKLYCLEEAVNKKTRHSRIFLSGIFLGWAGTQTDPPEKTFGDDDVLVYFPAHTEG